MATLYLILLVLTLLVLMVGLVPDEAWAAKKSAPKQAAGKLITIGRPRRPRRPPGSSPAPAPSSAAG